MLARVEATDNIFWAKLFSSECNDSIDKTEATPQSPTETKEDTSPQD